MCRWSVRATDLVPYPASFNIAVHQVHWLRACMSLPLSKALHYSIGNLVGQPESLCRPHSVPRPRVFKSSCCSYPLQPSGTLPPSPPPCSLFSSTTANPNRVSFRIIRPFHWLLPGPATPPLHQFVLPFRELLFPSGFACNVQAQPI